MKGLCCLFCARGQDRGCHRKGSSVSSLEQPAKALASGAESLRLPWRQYNTTNGEIGKGRRISLHRGGSTLSNNWKRPKAVKILLSKHQQGIQLCCRHEPHLMVPEDGDDVELKDLGNGQVHNSGWDSDRGSFCSVCSR